MIRKKIAIVAPYVILSDEKGYNRFRYICELLVENGVDVELFTSSFSHWEKQQRDIYKPEYQSQPYRLVFLDEPGYRKNIDFRRIISHSIFAGNLKRSLAGRSDIDLIYCAVPTQNAAIVAGKYAKSRGIPFIIDVQDLWPEAMKLVFNVPVISDILFLPLKISSETAYSMADAIVAVSDTYLNRAARSHQNSKSNLTVYIGTDLDCFDKGVKDNFAKVNKSKDEFWVTYIGTLGASYDIKTLISAVSILHNKGLTNIRPMIVGDGPLRYDFERFAREAGVDAVFTGMLAYDLMAAYLKKSDIVANAIRKNAPQSITNKIGDFLASGLPVVNGSNNEEFREMVEKYKIGYNYVPEKAESMAEAIEKMYHNVHHRKIMGKNARALAEKKFNRKITYEEIINLIKKIFPLS